MFFCISIEKVVCKVDCIRVHTDIKSDSNRNDYCHFFLYLRLTCMREQKLKQKEPRHAIMRVETLDWCECSYRNYSKMP